MAEGGGREGVRKLESQFECGREYGDRKGQRERVSEREETAQERVGRPRHVIRGYRGGHTERRETQSQ